MRDRLVDLVSRRVETEAGGVSLTDLEARFLAYMSDRAGEVIAQEVLLRDVWGYSTRVARRSRAVSLLVGRLRQKLEPQPAQPVHLLTVHGQGYRLETAAPGPTLRMLPTPRLWQLAESLSSPSLAQRCANQALSALEREGSLVSALERADALAAQLPEPTDWASRYAVAEFCSIYIQLLIRSSRLRAAQTWGRRGIRLAQQAGVRTLEGVLQERMAAVAVRRSEYALALHHFGESARLLAAAGDLRHLTRLMHNVGILHYRRGHLTVACDVLEQVVGWMEQHGTPRATAQARLSFATALLSRGRASQAAAAAQPALRWGAQHGSVSDRFYGVLFMGRLALEQVELAQAREHLMAGRFLAQQVESPRFLGNILRYQGWLDHHTGDRAAARACYQRSVASLTEAAGEARNLAVSLLWWSLLEPPDEAAPLQQEARRHLGLSPEDSPLHHLLQAADFDARRTQALLV